STGVHIVSHASPTIAATKAYPWSGGKLPPAPGKTDLKRSNRIETPVFDSFSLAILARPGSHSDGINRIEKIDPERQISVVTRTVFFRIFGRKFFFFCVAFDAVFGSFHGHVDRSDWRFISDFLLPIEPCFCGC